MKNLMLSLLVTVFFVAVSTAQQKEVVKETITKDEKKCESHEVKKACCADKKAEAHADHKHGEEKKCESHEVKKACCADKKAEGHADHKHGEEKKCESHEVKKACCADKKVEETKKEIIKVKEIGKIAFACPMKCEGNKTYAKEGKCPKCNMNLKPVKS